jgi:hypothetical protein
VGGGSGVQFFVLKVVATPLIQSKDEERLHGANLDLCCALRCCSGGASCAALSSQQGCHTGTCK